MIEKSESYVLVVAGRAGFPVWRRQQQQTADSTSRFGLGIFPAGGGPAGRRWIGDFPGRRRSGRVGVGLGIFRILGPSLPAPADPVLPHICTAHFSIGFQLYRTFFYRIPVVPHIFYRIPVVPHIFL